MSQLLRIYLDLLSNFIDCLFLIRFSEDRFQKKIAKKNKFFLFIILLLYSIPEHIPYSSIVSTFMDIFFLLISFYPQRKKIIIVFIQHEIIAFVSSTALLLVHTFIMNDAVLLSVSDVYLTYKAIICNFLTYITYTLFTNSRKMRDFHTPYYLYFNLVILGISFLLSYTTLYICKITPDNYTLPFFFTIIALLIIACISLYDKFHTLISENTNYKIKSELNRMKQIYSMQIEENLKELHSIRHDMKNHLIILDGYAQQKDFEKIHSYIERIEEIFVSSQVFDTPSDTVSAILNEKYQTAKRYHIDCQINFSFPNIHIDDFSIITILGNLLDNAITAAAKCEAGWIHIDLYQSDSYLDISIENSHREILQKKNGEFVTTKQESNLLHGIGLKNVRSTVETLNGQLTISDTPETFCVNILVPNY